ncbi:cytochrome P450 [Pisolithus sp. B1]|nr:cytochrome P450 [Pisolithus sp. B1]
MDRYLKVDTLVPSPRRMCYLRAFYPDFWFLKCADPGARRPFLNVAGEAKFRRKNLYGNVVRVKGVLGAEDQLVVADPKALSRILSSASQHFPKVPERRILSCMLLGKGIIWAEGEVHKRQRKICIGSWLWGSRITGILGHVPGFRLMIAIWMELVNAGNGDKIVLGIPNWVSRATLDAIGQGAFDVRVSSFDNAETPLAKSHQGTVMSIFGTPSVLQIFVQEAVKYIPKSTVKSWVKHTPNHCAARLREVNGVVTATAKSMVTERANSLLQGKIFSRCLANMDAEGKCAYLHRSQILFVGHETTSNTIGWTLLELARKPEIQSRLKSEIRQHESAIHARGDAQFSASDLENMPSLNAVVRESPDSIFGNATTEPTSSHRGNNRKPCDIIAWYLSYVVWLLKTMFCPSLSRSRQSRVN